MAANIFYSYAHEDKADRDELSSYLGVLRLQNKIQEWYDRKIETGINFNTEIGNKLDSSDIIIFLITKDFLNSEYCFGVEVTRAFELQKAHSIEIIPILLKPCLFEESRFSQLQVIPRDARPIYNSSSRDDAFNEVAKEIRDVVNRVSHSKTKQIESGQNVVEYEPSLNIVKQQITSYGQLYERIRQLMRPSPDRTVKMQQIFDRMKALALSSYPFLEEFSKSPLPGERLAAVSILHCFSDENYFNFLVGSIESEKPFVAYQAIIALRFAVTSVLPTSYPSLLQAINSAKQKLVSAGVNKTTDRYRELQNAENDLISYMKTFKIDTNITSAD